MLMRTLSSGPGHEPPHRPGEHEVPIQLLFLEDRKAEMLI